MRRLWWTWLGTLLVAGLGPAGAQEVSVEQNKLLARRSAEADAYRKLAEAVYGLQINSRTFVKDFVTESDEIRGEVDTLVKGVRLGTPIWYEDGSCEVPAEVTVAKVVEVLRSAHDRYYKGEDVKTADFETLSRRIDRQVIKVVGMGAPRPDLPPDLPAGAAELLSPAPAPEAGRAPIPDIWRALPPQARLLAIQAARMDASRRLAERIIGLRLTARTQVRDFVTESDVITTEVTGKIHPQDVSTYLHHDELIAEVTQKLPTEQVITTIRELHSRHYKGDDVKGHDIEELVKTVVKREFEATGMGVPPPEFLKRHAETARIELPDWATGKLEAEGEATDPAIDTPQGRLLAARAAEVVAKRNLAERIAGLTLRSETRVRDFLTEHDEIAVLVDAVVVDAVVTSTRFTDNTAIVKVELPGLRVWEVLRTELRRIERR